MLRNEGEILRQRFEAKVDRSGGPDACHVWTANISPTTGRARIRIPRKGKKGASRIAWIMEHGDPGKLNVLHTCDNPLCVNLRHLYLGTQKDNVRDMHERHPRWNS